MGEDVQRWNVMCTNQAMDVFYVATDMGVIIFVGTMTQVAKLLKGFTDDVLV